MIRFVAFGEGNKKTIIGLGLSDENIERLQRGLPIAFDAKHLGIDGTIVIFWGHTEAEMEARIREVAPDMVRAGS